MRHNNKQITQLEKELYGDVQQKKVKKEETAPIVPHQALAQIIKYLSNEAKALIALGKVKTIFQLHFKSLHPTHVLYTLYEICNTQFQFKIDQVNDEIQNIYRIVSDQGLKNELISVFSIILSLNIQLKTDDTYLFREAVKQLEKQIMTLDEDGNHKSKQISEEVDKVNQPTYEFHTSEAFQDFMASCGQQQHVKQKYLIRCLQSIVSQIRHEWAKPTINQFISNLNFNYKKLFGKDEQKEIDQIISLMQNSKLSHQSQQTKSQVDSAKQMQDYLKPTFEVTDCRKIVSVEDGQDAWQQKQSGL